MTSFLNVDGTITEPIRVLNLTATTRHFSSKRHGITMHLTLAISYGLHPRGGIKIVIITYSLAWELHKKSF